MSSAFSQSTFPSADYMEPSPPPPKRGLSREGSHEPLSSCPQDICLAPVLAQATELDREVSLARAAGCTAGCCLAAGGGKSCWCCHGAFTGGRELARV